MSSLALRDGWMSERYLSLWLTVGDSGVLAATNVGQLRACAAAKFRRIANAEALRMAEQRLAGFFQVLYEWTRDQT